MTKYCKQCEKDFDSIIKKCPDCGAKLQDKYTEEELEEIQKINEDFTVINTLIM
jgi:predicted amidophosphoribosyltransferase